jgi:hypothetical protein
MGLFGFIPKGIRKGVRDIFDANTEEDKRKRQAMGQAREYSQQTGTQKRANFIAGASRAAVSTSIPALQVRAINAGVGLFNKGLGQKLQSGQSDAEAGVGRYVADTPKTAVQLYGATNDLANNNPLLNALSKDARNRPGSMRNRLDAQSKRNTAGAFKEAKDMTTAYDQGKQVNARDNLTYKVANALPSTVESAALHAINPVLGQTVAGARTYANTAAESYDKTGKVNQGAAFGDAAVTAALERIQGKNIRNLSNQIAGKEIKEKVVKEGTKRTVKLIKDLVGGAGAEGFQEGTQQFASNLIAKGSFDKNRDVTQGVVESAGIGALLGSGTNVVVGASTGQYKKPKVTAKGQEIMDALPEEKAAAYYNNYDQPKNGPNSQFSSRDPKDIKAQQKADREASKERANDPEVQAKRDEMRLSSGDNPLKQTAIGELERVRDGHASTMKLNKPSSREYKAAAKAYTAVQEEIKRIDESFPISQKMYGGKADTTTFADDVGEDILPKKPKVSLTSKDVQADIAKLDAESKIARPEFDMEAANRYLDSVADDPVAFAKASEVIQQKIDETKALQAAYDDSLKYRDTQIKPEEITPLDRQIEAEINADQAGTTFMEKYNKKRVVTGRGAIADEIANAPDRETATTVEAQGTVARMTELGRKLAADTEATLAQEGHNYDEFSREIHQANRNKSEPAAWAKSIYEKTIKPALDEARAFGGLETGEQKYYLPQERPGTKLEGSIGNTLIDLLDLGDTGYTQARENRISIDELDHSTDPLVSYFTKTSSVAYQNQITEDLITRQIKAQTGRDISDAEAKQIRQAEEAFAEKLIQASEQSGGAERLDVVSELNETGQTKGREQVALVQKLGKSAEELDSSKEVYNKFTYPTGETLAQRTGFQRYNNAHGYASEMAARGDNVETMLLENFANINITNEAKAKLARGAQKRVDAANQSVVENQAKIAKLNSTEPKTRAERQERDILVRELERASTPEAIQERKVHAIYLAERSAARLQMQDFLETTTIEDKRLRKMLNNDAKRMLMQDRINQSFARKSVEKVRSIFHLGALGWSPRSALQNLTELSRAFGVLTNKEFATAMKQARGNTDILQRYGVDPTKGGDIENRGKTKTKGRFHFLHPMAMFEGTESIKDKVFLHGLENRYKAQGLQGEALVDAVMNDFQKYAVKGGMAGTLGFNKTKTGSLALQFWQYSIKDMKIFGGELKKAFYPDQNISVEQSNAARRYLLKTYGSRVPIYLLLNALFGATWEYVMGVFNPTDTYSQPDKDAGLDEKIVAKIPGGPFVGTMRDLYLAMREEARNAEEEEREIAVENFLSNPVKRNAAMLVPGGNQIFNRTFAATQDMDRGYNESSQGRARWEAPQFETDPVNTTKALVFGKNTTDQAKEYFGTQGVAGDVQRTVKEKLGKSDQKFPVSIREQEKIDKGANVGEVIKTGRERSSERTAWEKANPESAEVIKQSKRRTKDGKKLVSDVLTPEKWRIISSDNTGEAYNRLKQVAINNNKDFGDPIDPIYQLEDKARVKGVLAIRSQPTGNAIEREEILRATSSWYRNFEKAESKYYESMDFKEDKDSPFTNSQRKQQWQAISKQQGEMYDNQPSYVTQYYKLKDSNPTAAKQYFKDNADALSGYFDDYRGKKLALINAKRKLEGEEPIDEGTFNNVTFGYEDDERKAYNQLAYGKGYGSRGSGSSKVNTTKGMNPTEFVKSKKVTFKKPSELKKVKLTAAKLTKAKVTSKKSLV